VTNAINRIDQTVQQIALATAELARGSEQIMKSAEMMRSITKHVERSSQEQSRGSKQITRSIESINDMVNHLNRAQKEQTKGSEQVMKAVESIKGVADQQNRSMGELERAIDGLEKEAEVLRDEVGRFLVRRSRRGGRGPRARPRSSSSPRPGTAGDALDVEGGRVRYVL
jgi:methyl-accepting chemotaxis protein